MIILLMVIKQILYFSIEDRGYMEQYFFKEHNTFQCLMNAKNVTKKLICFPQFFITKMSKIQKS